MSKYRKNEFTYDEDFIISAECENCGHYTDDENDFNLDCEECGGDLIYSTSHEGCRCDICNKHIDMWEDAYRHDENSDIMICLDCYEELED